MKLLQLSTKYSRLPVTALLLLGIAASVTASMLGTSATVNAANKKDWAAGNIISDENFTNKNSMSVDQIQAFLDRQIGTCDVYGTGTAVEYGSSLSRAQYAKSRGWAGPPYVCLNKYYEVPKTEPSSGAPKNNWNKDLIRPTGSRSAAWIIKDAANRYGISPKVLLVKIATESAGPLTSDKWPLYSQYRYAMGSHCPDSGPGGSANCDSRYAGFSIQMYSAAELMRWYLDSMQQPWWSHKKPYANNSILWNVVERGCGSGNVYIQNKATAALYTYTPYQPNSAALNNMYGTGDRCSAYGNRNFWRVYVDWFGSTRGGIPTVYGINITSPISVSSPGSDGKSTVSFKVKNVVNTRVNFNKTVVQCRNYQGANCDSNYGGAWYLDPGQERTFSYTLDVSTANRYNIVPYVMIGSIWYKYDVSSGYANTLTFQKPDIRVVSPISTNPSYLAPRTTSGVSFKLKNYGSSPIRIDKTVVQCRYEGANCDSNYGGPITIKPSETMTFSYQFTSRSGGNHVMIPYFMVDGKWRQYNPSGTIQPTRTINVADLELSSEGITVSNSSPISGKTVTASFSAVNRGTEPIRTSRLILQCRLNSNINCDSQYVNGDVINPGEQKTYTATFRLQTPGSYRFAPYFEYMGSWQSYQKGIATASSKSIVAEKYNADMRLEGNIQLSPVNPIPGNDLTVSYSVRNHGTKPAYYQRSILQCRLNSYTNCDPAYHQQFIVIQPNETRTFTSTFPSVAAGKYRFIPYFEQNNEWKQYSNGTATTNKKDVFINPLTMTSSIVISPSTPSRNSTATATYKVKNFSLKTVTIAKSVLQCRINTSNCDSTTASTLSFAPGQEREFTQTIKIGGAGSYKLIPYYYTNNAWYTYGHTDGVETSKTLVIN